MMTGRSTFDISGLTGWDALLSAVLPRGMFLRRLARKLLKHWRVTAPPGPGEFSFKFEGECYEITSLRGAVSHLAVE